MTIPMLATTTPSPTASERTDPRCARTLHRFVTEFVNGGDEACLDALVHDDYVFRSPGETLRGRDGLRELFRGYRAAFPDFHLAIRHVLAAGTETVLDFELSGTHQGDYAGLSATGRRFEIRGFVRSTYRDGQIAEDWEVLDLYGLLHQLGAIPE